MPIPPSVAERLGDHLERFSQPGPDSLVFPGPDGGALRANAFRARHWRPAVRAAGLEPLRPHDLRHTAVALWIAAGASPKQIATWAGHTSVAVVLDRYGHLLPGHDDDVLARLDVLAQSPPATGADLLSLPLPEIPRVFRRGRGAPTGESESHNPV